MIGLGLDGKLQVSCRLVCINSYQTDSGLVPSGAVHAMLAKAMLLCKT